MPTPARTPQTSPNPLHAAVDDVEDDEQENVVENLRKERQECLSWLAEQCMWVFASSFFAFVVSNYWCHKERIFSSASAVILAIWLAPVVVLALGALLVVSNPWICQLIPESVTRFRLWSALKRHIGVYLLTGVSVCAGVALPLLYPDAFPAFPCVP